MGQSSSSGVVPVSVIIERNELQAGDHICRRRSPGSSDHHGIYVGQDKVIHLTRIESWHGAVYSSLESFLDGCSELRRCEYTTDDDAASDNAEVVRRAYSVVQFGFGDYRLDSYDSKTFAMYCKTGKYISRDTPRSNYTHWVPPMRNHRSTIHEFRPHHIDNPFPSASHHHDFHTRNHAFDFHTHRPM
ncbi:hypothetical protein ACP275_10G081400 [Erythranthe tilingii]